ncbi:MAG TPA: serine/threonine-protein kinase [Jiangellaceae bacterium]
MGEVFAGRYELLEPIGRGGMGTVWLVWDRRDEVHRAAKVLRQVDAESLIRFVREQTMRVEHPHCVTPRGWAGEDDRVLFTMDLVRGGSLATLIGDFGRLPPEWAAVLLDQLLVALGEVHDAGLVHRDVKPANILLEPTGRGRPHLRLGDFGVAVPLDEPRMTRAHTVLGTSGYQAPEQAEGADPDPRQDVWAAGVVMIEMLTGEEPPSGGPVVDAAGPPDDVDPVLWALAVRLSAADPDQRPLSAAEARDWLRDTGRLPGPDAVPDDDGLDIEVLEHLPAPGWDGAEPHPGAAASSPDRKPARWWRTRAAALGLTSVVVGLGLLIGAVVLWD